MTLNEVFPSVFTDGEGIFAMLNAYAVPWKLDDIDTELDYEYYGNHSGEKTVSPLVRKVRDRNNLPFLAKIIFEHYGQRWRKLWQTMSFTYNPIENYSMTETMTDDTTQIDYGHKVTRTDNLLHGKTGTETFTPSTTETHTPNITDTRTPNITASTDTGVYGFNSSDAEPTEEQTQTQTGTETTQRTGTETTQRTGTEQMSYNTTDSDSGTQANAESGTDTHTRNYSLTRSGNIGVTTSQQMIESERELWMWDYFNTVVFPDVDRVLTISIY